MPSDPILDEEEIIRLLKADVIPSNVDAIQTGAVRAMVDLYDREITREEYCNLLSPCLALYAHTAKLLVLKSIYDVHKTGELNDQKFHASADALHALVSKQVDAVVAIMERVRQCPTTQDVLH